MILLITYDLHTEPRDYTEVIDTIKTAGIYAHLQESVWVVDTSLSPAAWRDKLKTSDDDATYFVVKLAQNWASLKIDSGIVKWLKGSRSW